jgi:hypothetical protein
MKPHEIRELVNELTAIAQKYGKMQQIRDRIAHCLLDALEKAALIKENQS